MRVKFKICFKFELEIKKIEVGGGTGRKGRAWGDEI
jgi:hypothetical protein